VADSQTIEEGIYLDIEQERPKSDSRTIGIKFYAVSSSIETDLEIAGKLLELAKSLETSDFKLYYVTRERPIIEEGSLMGFETVFILAVPDHRTQING
jgi:hypothetical protein